MKEVKAYALVTKQGNLTTIDARLPIFWRKDVAFEEAEKYKLAVEVVYINPSSQK